MTKRTTGNIYALSGKKPDGSTHQKRRNRFDAMEGHAPTSDRFKEKVLLAELARLVRALGKSQRDQSLSGKQKQQIVSILTNLNADHNKQTARVHAQLEKARDAQNQLTYQVRRIEKKIAKNSNQNLLRQLDKLQNAHAMKLAKMESHFEQRLKDLEHSFDDIRKTTERAEKLSARSYMANLNLHNGNDNDADSSFENTVEELGGLTSLNMSSLNKGHFSDTIRKIALSTACGGFAAACLIIWLGSSHSVKTPEMVQSQQQISYLLEQEGNIVEQWLNDRAIPRDVLQGLASNQQVSKNASDNIVFDTQTRQTLETMNLVKVSDLQDITLLPAENIAGFEISASASNESVQAPVITSEAQQIFEKAVNVLSKAQRQKLAGTILVDKQAQAKRLFEEAALKGHTDAQFNVAVMYQQNLGISPYKVKKDAGINRAIFWYKQAANAGQTMALYNLALIYSEGLGVDVDHVQALDYLQQSFETGTNAAAYLIATMYEKGTLTAGEPDYVQASLWYARGAQKGDELSRHAIARLEGDSLFDDVAIAATARKLDPLNQDAERTNLINSLRDIETAAE